MYFYRFCQNKAFLRQPAGGAVTQSSRGGFIRAVQRLNTKTLLLGRRVLRGWESGQPDSDGDSTGRRSAKAGSQVFLCSLVVIQYLTENIISRHFLTWSLELKTPE